MDFQNLTYETAWRCVHCEAAGTVSVSTSEACDELFRLVVEAHQTQSPECAAVKRDSGLALQAAVQQEKLK